GSSEVGLDHDQPVGNADYQRDAQEGLRIEIRRSITIEKSGQHQRGENFHEFRRLKLKRADVDPRLHIRRQLSPQQQINEQEVSDPVEERSNIEEDVIVDDREDDHQRDSNADPQHL